MANAPVNPGDVLDGKYRVVGTLGAGGIGVVVEAVHAQLERQVAIKFLLPDANRIPHVVARFTREARAAARLKGEHVTRVLDVGALPDGSPYMVMEYLAGTDLSQVVAERGSLAIVDAVDYVLQACEALAEAHAARIVHRDLKPANLFLTRTADGEPLVKVLDFGISKALDSEPGTAGLALTASTTMIGTPLYMSPEQMRDSRDVDERTDIWALGAILYELASGRPPFVANSLAELCVMVMQAQPMAFLRVRPDAPPELGSVIERCLCKDRNDRFSNVSELSRALGKFGGPLSESRVTRVVRLSGQSERAVEASSAEEIPPTVPAPSNMGADDRRHARPERWPMMSTASAWGKEPAEPAKPKVPWRYVGMGTGLLVALGLGTWMMLRPAPGPTVAATAESAAAAPSSSVSLGPGPTIAPAPSVSEMASAVRDVVGVPSAQPSRIARTGARSLEPLPTALPSRAVPAAASGAPARPSRNRLLDDRE
jgi:serine/threonine protein kinase